LRQDPDIIMVGEIRDQETAKIAVNAAMTGHKLLSTLHTNNAATTLPRLIDMGVEPFLIASTLLVAIAQRLVRRVCPDCVAKITLTKKEAQELLTKETLEELFKEKTSVIVAKPTGCDKCMQTGYRGRVGIYEVLENSDGIRELITSRAGSAKIQEVSIKEGMTTMVQDGVRKILTLQTTVEEFIRVMQE
jgi:type IV pilus assembly protein PilB